jgi:lysozyme family protein
MAFELTENLREEYSKLFDTCDIRSAKLSEVDSLVTKIISNRSRYEAVGSALGIPWYFIGAIHNMESALRFTRHLHNGDPLTARTVHVPKGRPLTGTPPFTWEQSATDALTLQKLNTVQDWSMPEVLFQFEKYNGFGYRTRHPEVLSPYLWSYSSHYSSGKYIEDGRFDPDAVSNQCGAAVILRRLSEQGVIQFDADGHPIDSFQRPAEPTIASGPLITYSESVSSESAKELQAALNRIPGIFLLVDGIPGRRTSDAFRKVTGHFLQGDPRMKVAAASG